MNWSTILTTVLPEVISLFSKTTASVDPPMNLPPTVSFVQKRSPAVEAMQTILNQYVTKADPLRIDGWLGPKTEAALMQGIELVKPFLLAGRAL